MPRIQRTDTGNYVYHVLNRANARAQVFDTDEDYACFESILEDGVEQFDMRLLAYSVMPNHWHLVLYPKNDGDMSKFMGWVTNTHTRRWHVAKRTIGHGHLYQGRYKSFLCETDDHFLILVRYVEQNPKKANLAQKVEDWRWGSVWRRKYGTPEQKQILAEWPVEQPDDYLAFVNMLLSEEEDQEIERTTAKSIPFGSDSWREKMVEAFGLQQTLHGVGRPRNGG